MPPPAEANHCPRWFKQEWIIRFDDGHVADRARDIAPEGVDGAVEPVGTDALADTIRAVRPGGTGCFTGMSSESRTIGEFEPIAFIPQGVRLTAYSGENSNLPASALQGFLDDIATGKLSVPMGSTYRLTEITAAHRELESHRRGGQTGGHSLMSALA